MTYSIETEADFNTKSSSPSSIVKTSDEQTIAQAELNAYIKQQAQVIAPEIEIDSDFDSTWGTLYRVWSGYHLLGTFYSSIDGESSAVLGSPQVKQLALAQR